MDDENFDRQNLFEFTHVGRITFDQPLIAKETKLLIDDVFRALSIMKCGWVGIVGTWFYDTNDKLVGFEPSLTKVSRKAKAYSWYDDPICDDFKLLFPAVGRAFRESIRANGLQTAFHWFIESEQCAGAVEGSLIMQQAALECLAWLEIVQSRKICSRSKFDPMPASEKIRKLLALNQICCPIPPAAKSIASYAKDFGLTDIIGVMVDVRNALVHAEPNKTTKLLSRNAGSDERIELWYHVGGVLHQAFLASIGYNGRIIRRDIDSPWPMQRVRTVPWQNGRT